MPLELKRDFARNINDDSIWVAAARLRETVWPQKEPISMEELGAMIKETNDEQDAEVFMLWQDGEPIAYGRLFAREIETPHGRLTVGALASVHVRPDLQGKGYGKRIVEATFDRVADGTYPVILFQTGVPGFYEKLGSRIIDNHFFDSTGEAPEGDHWFHSTIMIYPASFDWPEGDIDLKGHGY